MRRFSLSPGLCSISVCSSVVGLSGYRVVTLTPWEQCLFVFFTSVATSLTDSSCCPAYARFLSHQTRPKPENQDESNFGLGQKDVWRRKWLYSLTPHSISCRAPCKTVVVLIITIFIFFVVLVTVAWFLVSGFTG